VELIIASKTMAEACGTENAWANLRVHISGDRRPGECRSPELVLLVPSKLSRCVVALAACSSATLLPAQSILFRNTGTGVAYVGSASCGESGCHAETYRDYMPTPHGLAMAPANTWSDLARVARPVIVFNARNNRYYRVYQQDGQLYQSAYELDKSGHKIYDVTHKIDFVVGGEIVGYSYLFQLGPWMFQAPLSYYAHSKSWELSPGYVEDDLGFTRAATTGCLMCHNGQPDPIPMRDGSYKQPPFRFGETSIGCETCHGPGALHVAEMQTKKAMTLHLGQIDTSIVNPAHLSPRLADDLCKECHQQGDTQVLYPGKTVLDFRPGLPLTETIAKLKLPIKSEQRAQANQLEARPPERGSLEQSIEWKNSALEMSKCYQATHGQLTCGTCHSIHHELKPAEEKTAYRAACLTCHTVKSCTLKPEDDKRIAAGDYCIQCHMEKRAVAGVAHSNDTKHRIVRYPGQPLPEVAFEQPKADLPGLLWVNRPESEPDARIPDVAQLEAYYTAARKDASLWPLWFRKLNELSKTQPEDPKVLNSLGAVALAEKKDNAAAADYFARALKQGSEEPTTFLNLATALANLRHGQQAEAVLERGVAAYPYSGPLTAQLAQQFAMDGEPGRARKLVEQYRAQFPEDPVLRQVEKRLDAAWDVDPLTAPGNRAPLALPR
jgi:hypothetical protein